MPPFLSVDRVFTNGDNDQVGRFLREAPGHWNNMQLAFNFGTTNLKHCDETKNRYIIVPCGEFLVCCVETNVFAVVPVTKINEISYFGCSPKVRVEIPDDINEYMKNVSNLFATMLSATDSRRGGAPALPMVAPEPLRIAPAPQLVPPAPLQIAPAPIAAAPVTEADIERLVAIRLAKVEADRRAQAEREAAAKLAEENILLAEKLKAMEKEKEQRELEERRKAEIAKHEQEKQKLREELEQLKNDDKRLQNQLVVRREERGMGIDSDKILMVVVILAAVFFMHGSSNTRMDSMTAKTDNELQIRDRSYAKTLSTLDFVQDRIRNLEYEKIDAKRDSNTEKTPPATYSNWSTFIALLVFGFVIYAILNHLYWCHVYGGRRLL